MMTNVGGELDMQVIRGREVQYLLQIDRYLLR